MRRSDERRPDETEVEFLGHRDEVAKVAQLRCVETDATMPMRLGPGGEA